MASRLSLAVVLCILVFAAPTLAQGTGDIVGPVTDSSDAVLRGVSVTATNLATNVGRTTVTSETGDYTFTSLPIGNYSIKSELAGFGTKTANVQIGSGDRTIQIRLEVYNVTNTANFQPPDGNFGSTTFGTISSTGNAIPRQMQFGMKYLF